jgi:RHS repeat-associated protein
MFRFFDPDNGLNERATVNSTAATYDGRGNMTTDPVTGKAYTYQVTDNQLSKVTAPFTTLTYDALGRLWSTSTGTPVTNYVSDGNNIVAEYDGSGALQRRYAFDGSGQPLVTYDASSNRSWMIADERGSIIALADDAAAMTAINTYDEYGIPAATNQGTFQYAGMLWLSRAGLYAPTFRAYAQHLGRFNQTDPIGIAGGINLYGYAGANPVNADDPLGTSDRGLPPGSQCTGTRLCGDRIGLGLGSSGLSELGPAAGGPKPTTPGTCGGGVGPNDILVCGSLPSLTNPFPQVVPAIVTLGPIDILHEAADRYEGRTFCPNPTMSGRSFFYPNGRVTSGKPGNWSSALADVDSLARANGLFPLGDLPGLPTLGLSNLPSLFSVPVGEGWWVYHNIVNGYVTFENNGLSFRFKGSTFGSPSVQINEGVTLPGGQKSEVTEVCHYY